MCSPVFSLAEKRVQKDEQEVEILSKAIAKAVLLKGAEILRHKTALCILLEDLIPQNDSERRFLEMIYTDEIGCILSKAAQAKYSDREAYYRQADRYLQNSSGLVYEKRAAFLETFRSAFRREIAEVKRYKDYRPALSFLRLQYGPYISKEILEAFVEENRLFFRFSITVDDVVKDLNEL